MIHHVRHWLSDRERERIYSNKLVRDDLYDDPMALKMYVLVRTDVLPPINQGIQALHAVVEYGIHAANASSFLKWAEEDKTLVLLAAEDERVMERIVKSAVRKNIPYRTFCEPDLDDMLTATAFEPMIKARSKDLFWGLERAR